VGAPGGPPRVSQGTARARHRGGHDAGPPEVLDDLGYSARDEDKITSISTANEAPEQGYRLRVRHFEALGFGFNDFRIHAHELPDHGVEGLLGMGFLGRFDFEVRMSDQQIRLALVELVEPPRSV